jgi:lysozyme family protein
MFKVGKILSLASVYRLTGAFISISWFYGGCAHNMKSVLISSPSIRQFERNNI